MEQRPGTKGKRSHKVELLPQSLCESDPRCDTVQTMERRLTTRKLMETFGMQKSILDIILEQRLRLLGHVGRMEETRLPKKILFGELSKSHGTKRRWRDAVKADVDAIGVGDRWYEACQDRKEWLKVCSSRAAQVSRSRRKHSVINQLSESGYTCTCGSTLRRQGDLIRHRRFLCQGELPSSLFAPGGNPRSPLSCCFTWACVCVCVRGGGGGERSSCVNVCVHMCVD